MKESTLAAPSDFGLTPTIRRVVFTGFEPFGSHGTNPSTDVAEAAARACGPSGSAITLPVTWDGSSGGIDRIADDAPDCLVLFGLAADRSHIGIERVAHNIAGGGLDNVGQKRHGTLDANAPALLHARGFRLGELAELIALRAAKPVMLSDDAGQYICNHTFFDALRHRQLQHSAIVFIHLPMMNAAESATLGRAVAAALSQVTRPT